jgi:hypothetical protein
VVADALESLEREHRVDRDAEVALILHGQRQQLAQRRCELRVKLGIAGADVIGQDRIGFIERAHGIAQHAARQLSHVLQIARNRAYRPLWLAARHPRREARDLFRFVAGPLQLDGDA